MARACAVLCALAISCSSDPYVIGRLPDAGPEDRGDSGGNGPDAGTNECETTHAGSLLCSGFEPADLSANWQMTRDLSGELERSTARAHSGSASLRATTEGAESIAVVAGSVGPLTSGELFLRAYVYVPEGLPTKTMNIFFIGDDPSPNPPEPFYGIDFNLQDGAVQLYSPQWAPDRRTGSLLIPRERWFCFRVRVAISNAEGAVDVFVDDQPAVAVSGVDTLPDEGVRTFRAGVDWSSGQTEFFEVFIDDIVLDTQPVSCGE
jgi:hypothetical protein